MMALWRAYELTGNQKYRRTFEKSRAAYKISEKKGLYKNNEWIPPRKFYVYGDLMGALGRRGTKKDAEDIQKLITYLTNQKRWTDNGYMGYWWEVTIENHNFFGRWCKALDMADAPKQIVSVSEFPIYYKKNGKVIVEMSDVPPFYNPDYFDKSVMEKYLPFLPQKLVSSVIFRIDNILLKKNYDNNWWVGTDNPDAVKYLTKIKENMVEIKKIIKTKNNHVASDEKIKKLLAETDSLFSKTAKIFGGEIVRKSSQPAGNPTNLKGELQACRINFKYLQNIIKK